MASCVQPLTSRTALVEALAAPGASLVVIDLHRKWCGPCTSLEPTFEKIIDEQNEKRKAATQKALEEQPVTEEGEPPAVPSLPPSLVPNALQVVSVSVENLKEWFGLVSNDDDGGEDRTVPAVQTSPDGSTPDPPVPASVSDESASKNHTNNNGLTSVANLLAVSDFFSPSEVEKLGNVVEEGKTTCKPVYVFLQVVTDGTAVGGSNKSNSHSAGAGSMPLPQAVPYKVAELVNGADAPKVYSLVQTFLAAA